MSEKRAKQERKEQIEILANYTITAYEKNGQVFIDVTGNINDFLLFRDIMNQAERAVINQLIKKRTGEDNPRIIVPNFLPPNIGRA